MVHADKFLGAAEVRTTDGRVLLRYKVKAQYGYCLFQRGDPVDADTAGMIATAFAVLVRLSRDYRYPLYSFDELSEKAHAYAEDVTGDVKIYLKDYATGAANEVTVTITKKGTDVGAIK